ncbi:ADP-ribose pyrophosphatase YjhB (NUDIX family) [Microbacterium marinum]|uniref:ADP-ribose pyrophosphatase YjhB (NUDIX family) n=1 Tax=Microbacterium marinum TaxID=421115 RepID=A0A7W7BNU9_9MICO|nr:DUF4916 domain-containing protein [Microbacterium marinum]MBB4666119.1 ADP-ribose pyrophosphatase YjhB (NUDIX family) [Microbacterium marinum]
MTFLPDDLYAQIEQSMPIACVDFVPVRMTPEGKTEVGLILRDSPFGEVWCHLGGRVNRGETIVQALRRHARDTLDVDLAIEPNAQPDYVYEWFPPDIAPTDGTTHGDDPRKHAIGLSYVVELTGTPAPRNEALDFAWFPIDRLAASMWPGSDQLIHLLVNQQPG